MKEITWNKVLEKLDICNKNSVCPINIIGTMYTSQSFLVQQNIFLFFFDVIFDWLDVILRAINVLNFDKKNEAVSFGGFKRVLCVWWWEEGPDGSNVLGLVSNWFRERSEQNEWF